MKKCNYCLMIKDLIDFPKKGAKCKSCVSEYKKEYALLNKDKIKDLLNFINKIELKSDVPEKVKAQLTELKNKIEKIN